MLWGGGNNSVKSQSTDLLGRPIDVMYIKSSGSDMKSIVPSSSRPSGSTTSRRSAPGTRR